MWDNGRILIDLSQFGKFTIRRKLEQAYWKSQTKVPELTDDLVYEKGKDNELADRIQK